MKGQAVVAGAFALGVVLLARPYWGIVHDAQVYIGQAMATLDPRGLGQDLMFRKEGQSGFTVFTPVAVALVRAFGPGPTAMGLALAALAAWTWAGLWLCRRLAPAGVAPWLCLAWLVLAPGDYGGLGVLHIAESFATPRPFAEAAAVAGLAAFLSGRPRLAAGLLALSIVIHPLMGLAAAGVVWVALVLHDRRWALPGVAVTVLFLAAAAFGAPVASRLFQAVDPAWLGVLKLRNAYLFPTLWRWQDWARLLAETVTVAAALRVVEPRARLVLAGSAAVALGGTAVGLAASVVPSLLILQLQTWRAAWVLAALSAAVSPILLLKLWREGPRSRLVLALLALAQVAVSLPALSAAAALVAAALLAAEARGWRPEPSRALVAALWIAFALVAAAGAAGTAFGFARAAQAAAAQGTPLLELNRSLVLWGVAAALVGARLMAERKVKAQVATAAMAGLGALALVLGLAAWDARPAFARAVEQSAAKNDGEFPSGAVFWQADDVFAPVAVGRPSWLDRAQGAGDVFSRPLAMEWAGRMGRAVALGFASHSEFDARALQAPRPRSVAATAVATLCRDPDGPSTIVLAPSKVDAPPTGAWLWRAPAPKWDYSPSPKPTWTRRDAFLVVPCR